MTLDQENGNGFESGGGKGIKEIRLEINDRDIISDLDVRVVVQIHHDMVGRHGGQDRKCLILNGNDGFAAELRGIAVRISDADCGHPHLFGGCESTEIRERFPGHQFVDKDDLGRKLEGRP